MLAKSLENLTSGEFQQVAGSGHEIISYFIGVTLVAHEYFYIHTSLGLDLLPRAFAVVHDDHFFNCSVYHAVHIE